METYQQRPEEIQQEVDSLYRADTLIKGISPIAFSKPLHISEENKEKNRDFVRNESPNPPQQYQSQYPFKSQISSILIFKNSLKFHWFQTESKTKTLDPDQFLREQGENAMNDTKVRKQRELINFLSF